MGRPYKADRTVSRKVLLHGIEEHVFFNHKLSHFDIADDHITAHFENGISVVGSLLVGADGFSSAVRKQHLPDRVFLDTGIRAIYGKTPFSASLLETTPVTNRSGLFLATDSSLDADNKTEKLALFGEPMRFNDNDNPFKTDDYIYWVLIGAARFFNLPDDQLLHLPSNATAQLSQDLTKHCHDSLKGILQDQDTVKTAVMRIVVVDPAIAPWTPSARVTFIGDAIHAMLPTAALGANTALQDAAEL